MDAFALIAAERLRLADELDTLGADEWAASSLCGAWTTHQVAGHLIVPFTVGIPTLVLGMVKALGNFDRANDRFARDVAAVRPPSECVEVLRANAEHHFTPPGHGPEAPLTDVITHGGDILRPLGRSVAVDPEALAVALVFASQSRTGFPAADISGLRLVPSDIDAEVGDGELGVEAPALSLLGSLLGRPAYLDDLGGDGADLLRSRVLADAR